jgi:2,4-dienoyl-CoA reductase-like NADH-dependent reductase (Old Yellow Enzyme family)
MAASSCAETLGRRLTLPNGALVPNRIMKSAMSENLAERDNSPGERLIRLYDTWARGGTGLLLTGNVMVDARFLEEPRNVVLEDERNLEALQRWARAGTRNGTHLWMQLNHPGKQVLNTLSSEPVAPSSIPLAPELQPFFNTPRALTEDEIQDIIQRFARAAAIAQKAGFTGVQIHGAHGYLVSQFLSPNHNQRDDHWGGSLANRMRFVLSIYHAIREATGPDFPVSIKLNSADFQKGGFSEDESMEVVRQLSSAGIDLIEISGGTYESAAMTGINAPASTRKREAYFIDYADRVRKTVTTPLAMTGGFRSAEGMSAAIETGAIDVAGLGRPLAVTPDLARRILAGEPFRSPVKQLTTGIKAIDRNGMVNVIWFSRQLARMARGKQPRMNLGVWSTLLLTLAKQGIQGVRKKRA